MNDNQKIFRLFAAFVSTLMLFPTRSFAVTVALDNASDSVYADGWQSGDDGGVGFGPWNLTYSGETTGLFHDPQFIDTGPLPGNSLGAPAFALTTGDRPLFYDTSEAIRSVDAPIGVGQTFSADADGSALDPLAPPFTTGNTFDLYGSNGRERFSLFTNNQYSDHWTATGDADTGIAAGSSFHFEFTLLTANAYNLVVTPVGGGDQLFTQTLAPLAGTKDVAIASIRITAYGTGSSIDGSKELFFSNLAVTGLSGDYNLDGVVDASDYILWRKVDGSALGFEFWRAHFGASAGSGSGIGAAAAAPEPASLILIVLAAVALSSSPQRRAKRSDNSSTRGIRQQPTV